MTLPRVADEAYCMKIVYPCAFPGDFVTIVDIKSVGRNRPDGTVQ